MASSLKLPLCATSKSAQALSSRESCHRIGLAKSLAFRSFCFLPLKRQSNKLLQVECTARHVKDPKQLQAQQLQEKFGCESLQFMDVGGKVVAQLVMNKGATARILVQDARVTSYKCRLWHGSLEEFLYTDVSEVDVTSHLNTTDSLNQFTVIGGLVPSFNYSLPPSRSLVDSNWFVQAVEIKPDEVIQVTLRFVNENQASGHFILENIITLTDDLLASAVMLINKGREPLIFTGSVSTHLAVRATEAISCAGLDGCSYFSPSETAAKVAKASMHEKSLFGKLKKFVLPFQQNKSNQNVLTECTKISDEVENSSQGNSDAENHWFTEKPESFVYPINGIHKIYSNPPTSVRVTDEGFRRSIIFESHGFRNLEVSSPSEDGENPYLSVNFSTVLSPIILDKGESWKGAQVLLPDSK
ncbi:hypothetical protein KP509_08G058400 [Ceratopteris richardii]|uniref:Uncharacterized protein n=1 Tax=Ceratopteris richardii TaxID=49495 RepID=A0A8T2UCN0_CERRI|nr:hypothetical protein KP509_08G058400 [Ceratopteris richardii]